MQDLCVNLGVEIVKMHDMCDYLGQGTVKIHGLNDLFHCQYEGT